MKKLYCNVSNIVRIDNIKIVNKSTYDKQFESIYDNLIKLDLNPISMDIPIQTTFDDDFITLGKVYIQFKDFDDCYDSYNILKNAFKTLKMRCAILKWDSEIYKVTKTHRRLPFCLDCKNMRAICCGKKYCRNCAKSYKSASFEILPFDMVVSEILVYLKPLDIFTLKTTSKLMNKICDDNMVWRLFLSKEYLTNLSNEYLTNLPKHLDNLDFDTSQKSFKTFTLDHSHSETFLKFIKKSNYIKNNHMRKHATILIQTRWRICLAKRKRDLVIREYLTKFSWEYDDYFKIIEPSYLVHNDYTRAPKSVILYLNTDIRTKNLRDKKMEQVKLRMNYQNWLLAINEPVFD